MSEENKAVDFNDPDSIENELAAAEETGGKVLKEKKPAKPRVIKVKYTADRDIAAGETIEFDYELPKAAPRGVLQGVPVEEMTDEQLKIEYRNANSVYYKTMKAGRDASKALERLEKVRAIMDERGIAPTARATQKLDAETIAAAIKSGKVSAADIQALLEQ